VQREDLAVLDQRSVVANAPAIGVVGRRGRVGDERQAVGRVQLPGLGLSTAAHPAVQDVVERQVLPATTGAGALDLIGLRPLDPSPDLLVAVEIGVGVEVRRA